MNFTFSEINPNNHVLSNEVAQAIYECHFINLELARAEFKAPIYLRSGYRTVEWELSKGRTGTSQHAFIDKHPTGIGAVDVAPKKSSKIYVTELELLYLYKALLLTSYTRICYYPTLKFFHCDFKPSSARFFVNRDGWKVEDIENAILKNG